MAIEVDPIGTTPPDALREALRLRLAGELNLPLLPATAARVMTACGDERAKIGELVDLVLQDPSLAAHLLRAANAATHAARVPILSLQQAMSRLGLGTVRNIAITVALKEQLFALPGQEERLRALWVHALVTAYYAKEIAELQRLDQESAFLCGLLHDVGMPLVLKFLHDLEREELVSPVPKAIQEAAMEEFHTEAGIKLAEAWHLGAWVSAVIRHHQDPTNTTLRLSEIRIVAFASALAYWAIDERKQEADFTDDRNCDRLLGLREGAVSSLLRRRERVLQAAQAFA
ncbi:MAG: HDOD domain-containing protein [Planctomycetes bacterium]|nr:HDOD domain-containing protein [Planctomycetota bacterium]